MAPTGQSDPMSPYHQAVGLPQSFIKLPAGHARRTRPASAALGTATASPCDHMETGSADREIAQRSTVHTAQHVCQPADLAAALPMFRNTCQEPLGAGKQRREGVMRIKSDDGHVQSSKSPDEAEHTLKDSHATPAAHPRSCRFVARQFAAEVGP